MKRTVEYIQKEIQMTELIKELEEKKKRLRELKDTESSSHCVSVHGSSSYMRHEMEIEELEEEIQDLEKKVS
jgi:hypothetical protein